MDIWVIVRIYGGLISEIRATTNIHVARAEFMKFQKACMPFDIKEAKENGILIFSDDLMSFTDLNDRHNPEIRIEKIKLERM